MKNQSAFPQADFVRTGNEGTPAVGGLTGGLTKREYFAAAALSGIISCNEVLLRAIYSEGAIKSERRTSLSFAREAVECADALIAELERKEE